MTTVWRSSGSHHCIHRPNGYLGGPGVAPSQAPVVWAVEALVAEEGSRPMGEGVGSASELNCVPNPCSQLPRGRVGSVHKGVALHEISLSLWCLDAGCLCNHHISPRQERCCGKALAPAHRSVFSISASVPPRQHKCIIPKSMTPCRARDWVQISPVQAWRQRFTSLVPKPFH